MSDNVVTLTTATKLVQPVDEEVVLLLRDMLARAERGEVQGVCIASVESDGAGSVLGAGCAYAGEGVRQNVHATLGAIVSLQHRFLTERFEQ